MAVLDKNGTEYLWNKAKEKFAAKDDVPETPEGVVLYTEQSLTDDQKAQARGNIGAVGTVEATEEVYTYVFTGEEIFVDANGIECFYLEGVTTEFVNGVYSLTYDNNGEIGTQNISKIGESDSGEFVSIIFTDYWLMLGYAKKDGATAEGMTFPKQGFYFMKMSGGAISIISITSTVPYTKKTQKIDEALLPDVTWDDVKDKPFEVGTKRVYTYTLTGNEPVYGEAIKNTYLENVTKEFALGVTSMLCRDNESGEKFSVDGLSYHTTNSTDNYIVYGEESSFVCGFTETLVDNVELDTGVEVQTLGESGIYLTDMSNLVGQDMAVISITSIAPYMVEGEVIREDYLPESVSGVTIRSSTSGSTKKFKLTVDDTGAISATEVV